MTETLSMRQPSLEMLLSLPIRKRKTMSWPLAEAGRFAVVVMKWPVFPVQAWRPASGFPNWLAIVAVYPPETKLPPAARMSVKAPPSIEISSTPPS